MQAHVTNLDASPYLGRLALCRIIDGELRRNQVVAWCRSDGTVKNVKLSEMLMTDALEREPAESAGPGDIVAIAGIPDITIGETLSDPENPKPLPLITVDEPSISMTIGINTSPLAGQSGKNLTARLVKARLDAELIGNVSIRVLTTERPDTWEVQGRGELQLAILVEMMRREGFELTVGKPQVVTREIDGRVHEPVERLTIDIPEDFVGVVTQLMGLRRGRLEQMVNHGTGWVRIEYLVPARGLIGFRTEFLTETRGTGLMHHVFEAYEPWHGELRTRPTGSLVADRIGVVTSYAMFNLQERGTLFVGPGTEVYEGMIVGENARSDDMDVNPTKEKKLTNVRSSTGDELERLIPPQLMNLEQALEFCRGDECIEVTPGGRPDPQGGAVGRRSRQDPFPREGLRRTVGPHRPTATRSFGALRSDTLLAPSVLPPAGEAPVTGELEQSCGLASVRGSHEEVCASAGWCHHRHRPDHDRIVGRSGHGEGVARVRGLGGAGLDRAAGEVIPTDREAVQDQGPGALHRQDPGQALLREERQDHQVDGRAVRLRADTNPRRNVPRVSEAALHRVESVSHADAVLDVLQRWPGGALFGRLRGPRLRRLQPWLREHPGQEEAALRVQPDPGR